MPEETTAADPATQDQCQASEHCVLPPGHTEYCLDERPLFEELGSIVGAGEQGLDPGDTLSHRTARACLRFGWADRTAEGNYVATPRGAFMLSLAEPAGEPSL